MPRPLLSPRQRAALKAAADALHTHVGATVGVFALSRPTGAGAAAARTLAPLGTLRGALYEELPIAEAGALPPVPVAAPRWRLAITDAAGLTGAPQAGDVAAVGAHRATLIRLVSRVPYDLWEVKL